VSSVFCCCTVTWPAVSTDISAAKHLTITKISNDRQSPQIMSDNLSKKMVLGAVVTFAITILSAIKSANKICHLWHKNQLILLADKIIQFYLSTWNTFCSQWHNQPTSWISVNKFCQHSDCLQWEINIYFSHLFSLLIYHIYFPSDRKSNASIILRSAICIREASWYHTKLQTIKSTDFLEQLNHAYRSWPILSTVWPGKQWTYAARISTA